MKKMNKFFVVLLAALLLVGCSSGSGDENSVQEITFWHAMNGAQEEALTKITNDFMAANENITVKLENQSSYGDLQAKINATLASPKDLPTMTQAYPNWLYSAAEGEMLVDLTSHMDKIENLDDISPALLEGAKIQGVQYGVPFNKSTEVLYYNADLLKQYGVEVPTTMEELATASKTIWEKSNKTVVGAGFDSLNNYYAIGMASEGVTFDNNIDITSETSVKLLEFYQEGIKEGYFRIAGEDKYLSGPFGSQVIAMNIGSMAGEGHVKSAADGTFEYGVAPRPSSKNLQQGTDLYVFQASEAKIDAVMSYMNYLVSPEAQLHWSVTTGYMPVRTSVQQSEEYKTSESKVAPILAEATTDLFALPVIANSDPAYNLTREFVEKILADTKVAPKTVLDDYKPLLDTTWNQ